jgi:Tfp pilus assembly protein PilF
MKRRVLFFALALVFACTSSFAQRGGLEPSMGSQPGGLHEGLQPRAGGLTGQLGSVTGSVVSLAGNPLRDVQVQLQDLNTGSSVARTFTDSSGSFLFSGVPSGAYELVAVSGMYQASDRVEVRGMTASTILRIPLRDAPPRDGGGSNTVSVAQYRVPEKAREEFMKAQAASSKLKIEEAQKHVQRALEIHPNYADALTLRAILELNQSDIKAAVDDTQRAIQSDSSYALAYTVMGSALNAMGSFDEALRVLQRSETLAPDTWQTYYEQGKAYLGKSDYRSSMQQLDKAASMGHSDFPLMHLVRARAFLGLAQYEDATAELETFLRKEPDGPESQQARIMLEKAKQGGK